MIAYHFPPVRVSSGIQRTLKFSQYLLDYDWRALILTVKPMAYEKTSDDQIKEISDQILVKRVFALDTARHLAVNGRYFHWMSLPDRWVTWCFGGVFSGLAFIIRYHPKFIWSTYPIATAHLIGLILHRITGIRWIADFRDSMTEDNYPENYTKRKIFRWLEQQTIKHCHRAVFTTNGALRMYAERYPGISSDRWVLIPNGYDEANFIQAENLISVQKNEKPKPIVLIHSGVLYPSERDPTAFFQALSELIKDKSINSKEIEIILRATGHDALIQSMVKEFGLQDIVFIEPSVSYESALAEMMTVDGLIIFQASNCNHQIPAKIYEYLRARKPIFALTDPVGDTASVLIDANIDTISPLDDKNKIKIVFMSYLDALKKGVAPVADDDYVKIHTREMRTKLLADLLNED